MAEGFKLLCAEERAIVKQEEIIKNKPKPQNYLTHMDFGESDNEDSGELHHSTDSE